MRVTPDVVRRAAEPGASLVLDLEVVNTTTLIDGVTATGPGGLEGTRLSCSPPQLALFPGATGSLAVTLALPPAAPAGRHAVTVRVQSAVDTAERHDVVVDLDVAARTGLELTAEPRVRRARRRAAFPVVCRNAGNTPLDVRLSATEGARAARCTLADEVLVLAPGQMRATTLRVRGARHRFGNDVDRSVTVAAAATPVGDAGGEPVDAAVDVVLRQRPTLSRGAVTALVLTSVVVLWAAAFTLAIGRSFGEDPLTKTAPASFYLGQAEGTVKSADSEPAGVLRKDGAVVPGVAGTVTGRVTAATTDRGVGRIVVQALRAGRDGLVPATSAATESDGTFRLSGLFPGRYRLRFGAAGYATTPDSEPVTVVAGRTLRLPTVVQVTGFPATVSGRVDTGDDGQQVPVRVSATVLGSTGTRAASPVRSVTTAADGTYRLDGLPAPNTYELRFEAPGYRSSTVVEQVDGGQQRSEPTVRLDADSGTIAGTVRDVRGRPLGGVAVSTTVDGQPVTTATPTVGAVGGFLLPELPTPGTYVLSFALAGHGVVSRVVGLGPGEVEQLDLVLAEGTGSVAGRVVDVDGRGLGGVTVTLGGAAEPQTTTTLTDGDVGRFALAGLPTPGDYTLTFELDGYGSQTLPVTLDAGGRAESLTATLAASVGRIGGTVRTPTGAPATGVTVTVTDGREVRTTTSVDSPAGTYVVADLPPGTYTVTASADGSESQTALVRVTPGDRRVQDFVLRQTSTS